MITRHRASLGVKTLCSSLGEPRASYYRSLRPVTSVPQKRHSPPRTLTQEEENRVLELLNSERFRDVAPPEIFATLLDEDR